jgi:hypothetical protein
MVVFEQRDNPHDIINSDIAIWDVKTGQLRILTRGTDPSWSSDGRTLLFKSPDANKALFITLADVATGRTRTIAPGVHPQFSPTARKWSTCPIAPSARTSTSSASAAGRRAASRARGSEQRADTRLRFRVQ